MVPASRKVPLEIGLKTCYESFASMLLKYMPMARPLAIMISLWSSCHLVIEAYGGSAG